MHDPHVEALVYVIEHDSTVSYVDAAPIEIECPDFRLKVEDKHARFELKEHYATAREARGALQPFIDQWEFEASLASRQGAFTLRFVRPVIIDRNPTPGAVAISAHASSGVPVIRATVRMSKQYPLPPSEAKMDIHNVYVQRMLARYNDYRDGQRLTVVAQICCEEFEKLRHELKGDADRLQISNNVLNKVRNLANNKGGQQGRHASALKHPLTQHESRFLEKAVIAMIIRAAKVTADSNQPMDRINVGNLLEISP